MNYSEQQRFFAAYQTRWLVCAAVSSVFASLALREPTVGTVTFFVLLVACMGGLSYLPKYLHMHHEPDKRYDWAVRSRWIISVAVVIISAALNFRRTPVLLVAAGAAMWLGLVNAFVMVFFQKERMLSYRWMPVLYFFADFWLLVTLAYLGIDPFVLASLLAGSLAFALLLDLGLGAWFPLGGMAMSLVLLRSAILPASFGFGSAFLIVNVTLVAGAASWLTMLAAAQARKNYEATVADLSAFTGMGRLETEDRLLRSQQLLADAWKHAALDENNKEELAKWYADNSLSYLFDIARFHLSYKHIAFSLDVMALSRGRCLDYGAGKGELAVALARKGMLVTYFDVPGKTRAYAEWNAARQDLNLLFTSSKDELRGEALKFDTVISLDVLEHMPDLAGELKYLNSLLAPDGRLILTVPAGATESHPMHLTHDVRTIEYLRQHGFRNVKDWKLRLTGSEILRKRDCVVMQKSDKVTVFASGGSVSR